MPHLENRKIIKVGETSFAVILPKAWLRYFDLQNGDLVEVISNSDVIIRPIQQDQSGEEKARTQVRRIK